MVRFHSDPPEIVRLKPFRQIRSFTPTVLHKQPKLFNNLTQAEEKTQLVKEKGFEQATQVRSLSGNKKVVMIS